MPQEDNFIPNTDYKNPSGESYPVGVNGRIDFSKISGNLALPNLVEIQTDSYQQFLEKGIDEVLADAFPIPNYNKDMFVEYVSKRFEEPPTARAPSMSSTASRSKQSRKCSTWEPTSSSWPATRPLPRPCGPSSKTTSPVSTPQASNACSE